MKLLTNRIALIKSETGWSNAELARRSGRSRSAPTDWLNGKVQDLSAGTAQVLSENSPYSASWLATGSGRKLKKPSAHQRHSELHTEASLVPISGIAQLHDNNWYSKAYTCDTDGYLDHLSNDEDAYALQIKGDLMFPSIRHNWYIVIEPNRPLALGEYVSVNLIDGRNILQELLHKSPTEMTLTSVSGTGRITLPVLKINSAHAITAIVSPSKIKKS